MANFNYLPFTPIFATSFTTKVIASTNDGAACIFVAPKSATIDRIGVYCTAISGSPTGLVELRNVTAGLPGSTLHTSQTFTPAAATWHWVTLGTPYAVTAGTMYAACVTYSSGSTNFTVNNHWSMSKTSMCPRPATKTTGTWAKGSDYHSPLIVPRYNSAGGDYIPIGCNGAISVDGSVSINTGTTPDEVGMRFTAPYSGTIRGAMVQVYLGDSTVADFDIILYTSGGTALATFSVDADIANPNWAYDCYYADFGSGQAITGGSDYIIAVKPTTTTSISVYEINFGDADLRAAFSPHGSYASRTDAGAWSAEDTDKAFLAYPIWETVTVSGGSGGLLVHPGMSGGMRG